MKPEAGGVFPVHYVDPSPDKVLGARGVEQFTDAMLDVVSALESEHVALDARGMARASITINFQVERDADGFIRSHWGIARKMPKLKTHLATMRMVHGQLKVEEELDESETQVRLPGLSAKDIEAERERERLAAIVAEQVQAGVAAELERRAAMAAELQVSDLDPDLDPVGDSADENDQLPRFEVVR